MSRITESLYNRYGINERKPLREDRRRNKKFLKEGKFDSLTDTDKYDLDVLDKLKNFSPQPNKDKLYDLLDRQIIDKNWLIEELISVISDDQAEAIIRDVDYDEDLDESLTELTESYIDLDDHKDELLEILISNGIDQQKAMQIVNEFGFINIKNLSDLSEYFNNEPTPGFYDAYRMAKSGNDRSPVPPYKATMVITDSVPIPHNILKNILKNEGWFSYNINGNTYFKNKDEFEFYYYLIYEEN